MFGTSLVSQNSVKITGDVDDAEFLARYEKNVLEKQSLLSLKTSFHLINNLLIGICHLFKTAIESDKETVVNEDEDEDLDINYLMESEAKQVH